MKKSSLLMNVLFSLLLFAVPLTASSIKGNQKAYPEGPRFKEKSISPWIERKDNLFIYKFNVFNLVPDLIDQKTVKSMTKVISKDINKNYSKEIGTGVSIKVYGAKDLTNPKLFKGDRIPLFIVNDSTP